MANRVKEDEKNEKIIRGLLKLPANRRCINCNSLGPQYVCTNFWTFICTNCSGIHREFTHRAKSISMAKFTSQEVAALQEGGNEHAREIYFKDWDPHRHSFPDSSNIDRLRTFIKHVYVDRRYAGERPGDKIERMKGDKDNNNGKQRSESSRSGSRSPPYQDHSSPNYGSSNDDRSFRYNSGDRSPGYDQGDNKRSPAHFEMVDGKSRNGSQYRRFEDQRLPDAPKPDGRSPDLQKQVGKLSPPMVRPIKDILGDDVPQLQVGDTPKSNGVKVLGDSAQLKVELKSSLSSSSVGSTDANSVQLKGSYMESLIDFSVDPNPSVVKAPEKSMPPQTIPDNANGGDWAAFDISGQQIIEPLATNANQLVSALEQLSVSGPTPSGRTLTYSSEVGSSPEIGGNIPTIQQQQPLVFPPVGNLPTNQSINAPAVEASNNLIWTPSPQGQGSLTIPTLNPAGRLPPVATKPLKETTAGVSSPPSSAQINSNGRTELPADIFTSLYPTTPASAPSWQRGPYPGMGYTIQYHTAMVMPSFTPTSKPVNPFDIASDPAPMATLPSMTPPATLLRSSSFDAPSRSWVPTQQFAYASGPFAISQVPNSTPQQIANAMMPVGNQIVMSDTSGSTFATSSFGPNPSLRYNQPSTPNSFTQVGGNPFG